MATETIFPTICISSGKVSRSYCGGLVTRWSGPKSDIPAESVHIASISPRPACLRQVTVHESLPPHKTAIFLHPSVLTARELLDYCFPEMDLECLRRLSHISNEIFCAINVTERLKHRCRDEFFPIAMLTGSMVRTGYSADPTTPLVAHRKLKEIHDRVRSNRDRYSEQVKAIFGEAQTGIYDMDIKTYRSNPREVIHYLLEKYSDITPDHDFNGKQTLHLPFENGNIHLTIELLSPGGIDREIYKITAIDKDDTPFFSFDIGKLPKGRDRGDDYRRGSHQSNKRNVSAQIVGDSEGKVGISDNPRNVLLAHRTLNTGTEISNFHYKSPEQVTLATLVAMRIEMMSQNEANLNMSSVVAKKLLPEQAFLARLNKKLPSLMYRRNEIIRECFVMLLTDKDKFCQLFSKMNLNFIFKIADHITSIFRLNIAEFDDKTNNDPDFLNYLCTVFDISNDNKPSARYAKELNQQEMVMQSAMATQGVKKMAQITSPIEYYEFDEFGETFDRERRPPDMIMSVFRKPNGSNDDLTYAVSHLDPGTNSLEPIAILRKVISDLKNEEFPDDEANTGIGTIAKSHNTSILRDGDMSMGLWSIVRPMPSSNDITTAQNIVPYDMPLMVLNVWINKKNDSVIFSVAQPFVVNPEKSLEHIKYVQKHLLSCRDGFQKITN